MHTSNEDLMYFKFQYSRNDDGTRFKHTYVNKLPILYYKFNEGTNWSATDYRVTTKINEVQKWFDEFWESRPTPKSVVNRGLYEKELEQVITKAYEDLNEKWTRKLESDFQKDFDEKLLGFLSGKK